MASSSEFTDASPSKGQVTLDDLSSDEEPNHEVEGQGGTQQELARLGAIMAKGKSDACMRMLGYGQDEDEDISETDACMAKMDSSSDDGTMDDTWLTRSVSPSPPPPMEYLTPKKQDDSAMAIPGAPRKKRTKKDGVRSRAFAFTWYGAADYDWQKFYEDIGGARYLAVGREVCPTTKREHWQGYVAFKSAKARSAVSKLIGGAHLEIARGNAQQNRDYCFKEDGTHVEIGVAPAQGKRTDLAEFKDEIDRMERPTMMAAFELNFDLACRYRAGISSYIGHKAAAEAKGKARKVKAYIFWGATGTGKTYTAWNNNKDAYMTTGCGLKWWDGYQGEQTVIIDEYSNDISVTAFIKLLDVYPLRLEIKGSHIYAAWDKIIITTNLQPVELHARAKEEHRAAMRRRIWEWVEFRHDGPNIVTPGLAQDSGLYREDESTLPTLPALPASTTSDESTLPTLDVDTNGFIFSPQSRPKLVRSDCIIGESVPDFAG